jgi:hypothetical protein
MASCEHDPRQQLQQRDLACRLKDYANGYRDGETDRRNIEHGKTKERPA